MKRLLLTLAILALAGCDSRHEDEEHHANGDFRVTRESLYNRINVEKKGTEVDMKFRDGSRAQRQSAVDLADPERLIIPYTRTMLAAALVQPAPRSILQIGLGGGALNRFLAATLPGTTIRTAELDGDVLAMAEKYMAFKPTGRDQVTVEDGRTFLKRDREKYDWIFLDAFRSGHVPLHLKSREFYELVRAHLAPGGVVAANTVHGTRLYDSDLATFLSVFPEVHVFRVTGKGNAIILCFNEPRPDWPTLPAHLPDAIRPHVENALTEYTGPADAHGAQVLTDDFIPAESLQEQRSP